MIYSNLPSSELFSLTDHCFAVSKRPINNLHVISLRSHSLGISPKDPMALKTQCLCMKVLLELALIKCIDFSQIK